MLSSEAYSTENDIEKVSSTSSDTEQELKKLHQKNTDQKVQTRTVEASAQELSDTGDINIPNNRFLRWLRRIDDLITIKENGVNARSILQTFVYNDALKPVRSAERTWGWSHYVFFWITGSFNINTWQISATGLQLGLNWWQTWICVWVGYSIVAVFLVLASRVGNMYHLSFPIAVRVPFGTYFSVWIVLNRLVMAVVWMATLSWLGSQCVQLMLRSIFGNDLNTRIHDTIGSANLTSFEFLCFIIFWVVSMPFLWLPPHKLRYVFAVKSAITPFAAFGFLIWTLVRAKGHLSMGTLGDESAGKMSQTALAWAVIRSIVSALDNFSTLILNAPDFSRFATTPKSSMYSQLFALPVCYAVISLVGILSASAAYQVYGINYWNPLDILSRYLDHQHPGNRAGVFLIAFAFAFDQLGANLSGNAIPAGTDMTALLPKYINIRRGSYICACLSLAITPWNLMASSSKFTTALSAYAVFLSAIAGVVVTDYYIIRRGYVNLKECYSNAPGSMYMYNRYGTNWRAVVAYLVGIVPNFPGFIGSVGPSVPEGAMRVFYLNYFIGFLISALVYIGLVYWFPMDDVPRGKALFHQPWREEWAEVEDFGEVEKLTI